MLKSFTVASTADGYMRMPRLLPTVTVAAVVLLGTAIVFYYVLMKKTDLGDLLDANGFREL